MMTALKTKLKASFEGSRIRKRPRDISCELSEVRVWREGSLRIGANEVEGVVGIFFVSAANVCAPEVLVNFLSGVSVSFDLRS